MQILNTGSSKNGLLKTQNEIWIKIVTFPPLSVSNNVLLIEILVFQNNFSKFNWCSKGNEVLIFSLQCVAL